MKILPLMLYSLILFSANAQNTWRPITKYFTSAHSYMSPKSIGFENNLMNNISDHLRLDEPNINSEISCISERDNTLIHQKGFRKPITIQCSNNEILKYIREKVSRFYGQKIGSNLKYAFKSGPYIFSVCNYDDPGEHKHNKNHYVCRTPTKSQSKEQDIETFCYEMGLFHRTCNPHKALVSTEIILLNSQRRWKDIDRTLITRFISKELSQVDSSLSKAIVDDLINARVIYAKEGRGSATADKRYPKTYLGKQYLCHERILSSSTLYIESEVLCGPLSKSQRQPRYTKRRTMELSTIIFNKKFIRLKQTAVNYPMLGRDRSSIDP